MALFDFSNFWSKVLSFCLGWPCAIFPISAPRVAKTAVMNHHTQHLVEVVTTRKSMKSKTDCSIAMLLIKELSIHPFLYLFICICILQEKEN
jgi:hypothetical protein